MIRSCRFCLQFTDARRRKMMMRGYWNAFTLIELLVVVAIIAILPSMSM